MVPADTVTPLETVEPVGTAATRTRRQQAAVLLSVAAEAEAVMALMAVVVAKAAAVLQTAMPLQHRSVVAAGTAELQMAVTVVLEEPAVARSQLVEERRPPVPTERRVSSPIPFGRESENSG